MFYSKRTEFRELFNQHFLSSFRVSGIPWIICKVAVEGRSPPGLCCNKEWGWLGVRGERQLSQSMLVFDPYNPPTNKNLGVIMHIYNPSLERWRQADMITQQPAWLPGQWEALSNRMKWTAPEKRHQRVSSGLCTYPHMCAHTERTGVRESGVNAVGFLKGRRKGGQKESGNVCGGGNATAVILRLIVTWEWIDRGSVLGKAAFARARGPWPTCDLCFFLSASVSMPAASWLRPFLNSTKAPFPGHIPTLLGPITLVSDLRPDSLLALCGGFFAFLTVVVKITIFKER